MNFSKKNHERHKTNKIVVIKTIRKQFKSVVLILSMLILFQGCIVYKSVPISLEQAAQNETKVRVKTKTNEKFRFNRIGVEDGKFYGVKKRNNTGR